MLEAELPMQLPEDGTLRPPGLPSSMGWQDFEAYISKLSESPHVADDAELYNAEALQALYNQLWYLATWKAAQAQSSPSDLAPSVGVADMEEEPKACSPPQEDAEALSVSPLPDLGIMHPAKSEGLDTPAGWTPTNELVRASAALPAQAQVTAAQDTASPVEPARKQPLRISETDGDQAGRQTPPACPTTAHAGAAFLPVCFRFQTPAAVTAQPADTCFTSLLNFATHGSCRGWWRNADRDLVKIHSLICNTCRVKHARNSIALKQQVHS